MEKVETDGSLMESMTLRKYRDSLEKEIVKNKRMRNATNNIKIWTVMSLIKYLGQQKIVHTGGRSSTMQPNLA